MELESNSDHEVNLDPSFFFWRYLDIPKFLSLINIKTVFFTRLDRFNDLLEGMTDKNLADLQLFGKLPDYEKMTPELPEEIRLEKSIQKEEILKRIEAETKKSQLSQFASCWFYNKGESLAMWDLYSTPNGVVIKIKPSELFDHIKAEVEKLSENSNFHTVTYGFCDYRPLSPYDISFKSDSKHIFNGYKKDLSYDHEKEFRFIAVLKPDKVDKHTIGFQINVQAILDKFDIIAHPKMDSWKIDVLNETISKLGYDKKIDKSQIRVR